jgi:dihydroflavonol-4-reductase
VSRIFITGGSGLLGGALIKSLRADGLEVIAQARSSASRDAVSALGAAPSGADLLDEAGLREAMAGCDVVYHVAGVNTLCPRGRVAAMERINGHAPAVVVRAAAAAGVRRVVHTSSASTLGERDGTVGSEDTVHRGTFMSTYERTKHMGERAALGAGREAGVEVISINPSSVQGPGRASGTGKILLAVIGGKMPFFIETFISVNDIEDCIRAHRLAADRGTPGERYVINGASLTTDEALELLRRVAERDISPRIVPAPVAMTAAAAIEAGSRIARRKPPLCREMMRVLLHGHQYDGSRATRELGLEYTPVEDTLRATIEWAVAEGHLAASRAA